MVVDASSRLEETFITKITVINPMVASVPLPKKYHCLFHGAESVRYGKHVFRFPITHLEYKRLVSSLQSDFKKVLQVNFGAAGFEEI